VAKVVAGHTPAVADLDLDAVLAADSWARESARRSLSVSAGSRDLGEGSA